MRPTETDADRHADRGEVFVVTAAAAGPGGKWCPDDVCGVVEAVGTKVTPFKPGDEVFGMPPRA